MFTCRFEPCLYKNRNCKKYLAVYIMLSLASIWYLLITAHTNTFSLRKLFLPLKNKQKCLHIRVLCKRSRYLGLFVTVISAWNNQNSNVCNLFFKFLWIMMKRGTLLFWPKCQCQLWPLKRLFSFFFQKQFLLAIDVYPIVRFTWRPIYAPDAFMFLICAVGESKNPYVWLPIGMHYGICANGLLWISATNMRT